MALTCFPISKAGDAGQLFLISHIIYMTANIMWIESILRKQ